VSAVDRAVADASALDAAADACVSGALLDRLHRFERLRRRDLSRMTWPVVPGGVENISLAVSCPIDADGLREVHHPFHREVR
jgi:hypothetical protein